MSSTESPYLELLREIQEKGEVRADRTGVGTKSLFGKRMEFSLDGQLPVITTKKVLVDKVVHELLWMVSGSTAVRDLQTRGVRFWDANSTREFLDARGLTSYEEGDLGPVYGFQWRHWGAEYTGMDADYTGAGIDQLQCVVDTIRNDPGSRRNLLSAWNVADVAKMALPPCHLMAQFYVSEGTHLDCQLYQRSADMFLGVPFNITSYSLLTCMLAKLCGLRPGRLIHVLGDAHVYLTHEEAVKTQLSREPYSFPTLRFKKERYGSVDEFSFGDFIVENYRHYPFIRAQMAV